MNKILAILAACAAIGSPAFAQVQTPAESIDAGAQQQATEARVQTTTTAAPRTIEPADDQALGFHAAVGYESKYVFRGLGVAKDSLQTDLALSYQTFGLGLWTHNPLRSSQKETSEINIYGSAGTSLDDTIYGGIGFTLYHYTNAGFLGSEQTTFEPNLRFTFDLSESVYIKPTLLIAYDVDWKDWTFEAGVDHVIALADQLNLELGAAIGYRVMDQTKNYIYGSLVADVVYAVKAPVDLYAGIRGSFNDISKSRRGDLKGTDFWFGAGVRANF